MSRTLIGLALWLLVARVAPCGDWPQILGPERNGTAQNEPLPDAWPASGPAQLWKYPLGHGYAGPAIVGRQAVVFHRTAGKERVEAVDVESGRSLWRTDFPATYRGGVDADLGPRCVPLIHDGVVYAFGAAGAIYSVELAGGKTRWQRDLYGDYEASEGYFGAGSTPVVAAGKLLVNVGGRGSAGIVALDLATGQTAWKATDEAASYSSPVVTQLGERPTAIFVTRMNCLGIDPANGNVRFKFPFGKQGPTVNAASPLVVGDQLFVTASYNVGARVARISAGAAQTVWDNDETLSSQYSTAVHADGYLYGNHGREDVGRAMLRCVRLMDGKVMWTEQGFGMAHLVRSGDKLLVLRVDGKLILARTNSTKFEPLSQFTVSTETTRAMPALSSGRMVLRTNVRGGDGELICLQVGGEKP